MTRQFDAISYAQELEATGVPKPQAEVHAKALSYALSDSIVLPEQLAAVQHELGNKIDGFGAELRAEMGGMDARLRAKMGEIEVRLRAEMHEIEVHLRAEMGEIEVRLRAEMREMEARLRAEMREMEARLNARIDRLEERMKYMMWMNGLTLALVVGMLVKSWMD